MLSIPRALGLHDDLPWVIEQTKQAPPEAREAWSHLLRFSFNFHDKKHLFLILKARIPSAHIRAAFRPKELYQRLLIPRRFYERFFLPPVLRSRRIPRSERPDVPAAVEACLCRIEAGEAEAWVDLTRAVRNPSTDEQHSHIDPDLKKYGGWSLVGPEVQKRIVEAAKAFVKSYDQRSGEWLVDGEIPAKGIAGFKALRLLAQEDLPFLQTLTATFWQSIAVLILSYPDSFTRWGEPDNKLARLVFQNAEEEAVRAFIQDIDAENQHHGTVSMMSRLVACWDCGSLLQRTLEQKLHDASLKPSTFAGILRALLAHGSADAKAYAIMQAQTSTERKLVAASILFQAANDAGWSTVWPAISSNVIFGRRFTQAVSGGFDEARLDFLKKLTEDEIADLYTWVSQQFPENEDPAHPSGRAHSVGNREEIGMWRDKLLEYLVNRGTLPAYNAIQKIQASGCHDCTYSLIRALRAMRERWIPLTVEQILAMQRDTEKRLVRNADELLDVIVESLQRLEKKLHDANPAVRDVWDATSADKFKPVIENEFSDYVARHLEEDLRRRGIVVNREVEIHRGEHRNDLLVTAVQEEPINIVKVTIETKGCWHDELMTGMESQLVGDYLTANECQHGIYLVGWFKSDKWDPDNIRRWSNAAKDWTLDAARTHFSQQAEGLSTGTLHLQAFVMDTGIRH